jgi:hypothetical protein
VHASSRLAFGGGLVIENSPLAGLLMNVHSVKPAYDREAREVKRSSFFEAQFSMANAPAGAALRSLNSSKLAESCAQAFLLNAQWQ